MKQSIPKSQPKIIDKNNPWWTPQLQQQRKTVSKLYRTATRFPSERNKNRYKIAQKRYAKECDKTRDRSWSDFKEKLDSIEAINQFRKIIERHINIRIGTLVKPNGDITDPGEDTITHLLSVHFPNATTKEKTQYNHNKYITKTELEKWEQDWITQTKLKLAFKGFHNKKSPGPDQIRPILLKYLPPNMQILTIKLYKLSALLEFTPTKWKECNIVFSTQTG